MDIIRKATSSLDRKCPMLYTGCGLRILGCRVWDAGCLVLGCRQARAFFESSGKKYSHFHSHKIKKMDDRVFDEFISSIGNALVKMTGDKHTHIHFYIKGMNDSLLLVYWDGTLASIEAKGVECGKGEYVEWVQSEFSNVARDEIFSRFYDRIDKVVIDHPKFKKTWNSLDKFVEWLGKLDAD
jgi:hypothetical protein